MARSKKKTNQANKMYLIGGTIFFSLFVLLMTIMNINTYHTSASRASTLPTTGYVVSGDQITYSAKPITLHGINWYGFESYHHVVEGLQNLNWKKHIDAMQAIGFNAVRIPVCPETLKGVKPDNIEYYHNQDLQGKNSLQLLDTILNEFNRRGMYILLDHHVPDCITDKTAGTIPPLWYNDHYSEDDWIQDLQFMAKRYKNLKYFVGIDLKNEPHDSAQESATWGTGDESTDWNTAAEKAGKAVLDVNPNILIFVEGVRENPVCSTNDPHNLHTDGSNFEPMKCCPIDPAMIPKNKLVISPHEYGPALSNSYSDYFNATNFPKDMDAVWNAHWGFLQKQGYAIAVGEFGSWYATLKHTDPIYFKDKIWMDAFMNYMVKNKLCNSFYWAWTGTSYQTGGVLDYGFVNTVPEKVAALKKFFAACGGTKKVSVDEVSRLTKEVASQVGVTPTTAPKMVDKSNWCKTRPNVPAPAPGYYWEADCGDINDASASCYTPDTANPNKNCPQNSNPAEIGYPSQGKPGYVNPSSSNWCYGFEGPFHDSRDFRCMMLHYSK